MIASRIRILIPLLVLAPLAQAAPNPATEPARPTTAPSSGAQPLPAAKHPASAAAKTSASVKPTVEANPAILLESNVFDPQRKLWTIPAPPPPPPPAPPALTDADVKVQGVIISGEVRKALVELSSKLLAQLPPTPGKVPRAFKVLSVGESVGGYRLADIKPGELVFEQGGATSTLAFKIAKNRPVNAPSVAPPDQVAIVMPAALPNPAGVDAPAAAPTPAAPEPAAPAAPATPSAVASAEANPAAAAQPNIGGQDAATAQAPPQGMSLLEAIQWAQRNANSAAPNPFTNLNPNK